MVWFQFQLTYPLLFVGTVLVQIFHIFQLSVKLVLLKIFITIHMWTPKVTLRQKKHRERCGKAETTFTTLNTQHHQKRCVKITDEQRKLFELSRMKKSNLRYRHSGYVDCGEKLFRSYFLFSGFNEVSLALLGKNIWKNNVREDIFSLVIIFLKYLKLVCIWGIWNQSWTKTIKRCYSAYVNDMEVWNGNHLFYFVV